MMSLAHMNKAFLFIFDYTDRGLDQMFLYFGGKLTPISADNLVKETAELVCHDFWLIAPSIYKKTGKLPRFVTDIEELRIASSGIKTDKLARDRSEISKNLSPFADSKKLSEYMDMFTRRMKVDLETLSLVGHALLQYAEQVKITAGKSDEWNRYIEVERVVSDYLIRSAADGIAINTETLKKHKREIDFDYYMSLKKFSAIHNMPLEPPSDDDVVKRLETQGLNFDGVSVDYVLHFVPTMDNFSSDVLRLRKLHVTRKVLTAIPFSQTRIFPIVDSFGSITSRIYFKDPSLQNLAKRHRDILIPDAGKVFSYVDYEQYEAGIMAALSKDPLLLELYASGDLYQQASKQIFNTIDKRKEAKRLFLSFAYGMKKQYLIDASIGYGAHREEAKKFFNQFSGFENWKKDLWEDFRKNGRIGTALGNFLSREKTGPLSDKEKRSSVSQVVQGTASLIFKKLLLELSKLELVQLKVPMHDAALFQHPADFDQTIVVNLFKKVMTEHFQGEIVGKASLAIFIETVA
jgi:DNA polymerase-1